MPLKTSVFSRANPDQQDSTQENSELINQQLYLARVALHLMQSRSQASENARIKYSQNLGKTHKITHGRETTPVSIDEAKERHAKAEAQNQREKSSQQIGQERIKETLIDAKKVALAEQTRTHSSSHSSNRDTSADSFNKNGAGSFKKISRISKNRSQWKKFK